jgi:hypothetical protein
MRTDDLFKNKRAKEKYLNNLERELRQLFFNLRKIKIEYCNSKSNSLIRASDVIANRFLSATRENAYLYLKVKNLNLLRYPNIN